MCFGLISLNSCEVNSSKLNVKPATEKINNTIKVDLKEIKEQDKLVVLAENSTASYFIYRGKKMGLEYEILSEFAKHLGVELEIKMIHNLDNIIDLLNNGEGDILACNYTITKERSQHINFTQPYIRSSQVLVQRKPADWKERTRRDEWKSDVITDPIDLNNKTVHVWKNSSYYDRLVNLQEELGDTIFIEAVEGDVLPEQLIEQVADGLIDYTVSDQLVAMINKRFYPNLDIDLNLSVRQQIAFGMRKSSKLLKLEFDKWLSDFSKTSTFAYIKHKYLNMSQYSSKAQDEFSSLGGGKISKYDDLFKEIAKEYNWDWKLLAALVYQESKFKSGQKSWAGAYGLMQFMPGVGPSYGVYPSSPPIKQIRGGMKKLYKNHGDWHMIPDSIQRIKFTLATYNAGLGHVQDAQRLAPKYGKDPKVWDDNVEVIALNLNTPKYYKDEVVRYGYLRGSETYHYVREIFTRFNEFSSAFESLP